jgi:hypothetical protein
MAGNTLAGWGIENLRWIYQQQYIKTGKQIAEL